MVWMLRIITGCVFIFSSFVKAIDPWGGMYKMHEYMAAMGLSLSYETECALAVLLAGAEFALGIALLFGILRRVSTWCLGAFMAVMTPLTLWIWLSNPVADCGCFGDAIVISNGATFAKNVVLAIFAILLIIYNRRVVSLISAKVQWIAIIAALVYVGIISLIGFNIQPMVDFRPYKVGSALAKDSGNDVLFVYERNGVQQTFCADSLPGDDWKYVGREQGAKASELAIFDSEGEDVTDEVLDTDSAIILVVNDPERHGISRSLMQNQMSAFADSLDYDMFALVATQPDKIDDWTARLHADYPIYAADDTDLKELVRGDAAVVVVKDGIIYSKANLYSFGPKAFETGNSIPVYRSPDNLLNWLTALLAVILLLLTLRFHIHKQPKIKDDDPGTTDIAKDTDC